MLALLRFFAELALLRRGPQDLPVSGLLAGLLAAASLVLGAVNGREMFGGIGAAFGANLLDLLLTIGFLLALLRLRGRVARWQQTASAFFGLAVLAGLVALVVAAAGRAFGALELATLINLVIAVWLHLALGSVLRHALDIPLAVGVLLMLGYTVLALNLIVRVFPLAVGA